MLKLAIITGLLFVAAGWAQSSSVSTARVFVDIRPEATLAWQGDSIVVKARLAPGTQARVWTDGSCGAPSAGAQVVSASGTVAIDLATIGGAAQPMVCLSSSDGKLNLSLAALRN